MVTRKGLFHSDSELGFILPEQFMIRVSNSVPHSEILFIFTWVDIEIVSLWEYEIYSVDSCHVICI